MLKDLLEKVKGRLLSKVIDPLEEIEEIPFVKLIFNSKSAVSSQSSLSSPGIPFTYIFTVLLV